MLDHRRRPSAPVMKLETPDVPLRASALSARNHRSKTSPSPILSASSSRLTVADDGEVDDADHRAVPVAARIAFRFRRSCSWL